MRLHRVLLAAPLTLALVLCPTASADTVVAQLAFPSAIRDYAGIQVFSAYDGNAFHLVIRRAGAIEVLPVATSKAQFDVDIGPDSKGRPMLVYTRCKVERPTSEGASDNSGCDLVRLALAGAAAEQPIRGANTSADELHPTLWKGRIAFARERKGSRIAVVYSRRFDQPRSQPSRRLPGIPARVTGGGRTVSGTVEELELKGDDLAELVIYDGGRTLSEVRVVGVSKRTSRVATRTGVGEGGQFIKGIGFADRYLGWALNCVVSCGRLDAGIYRYRLATGALSRARFSPLVFRSVVGMALVGADSAYMVDADVTDDGCGHTVDPAPPGLRSCQVILAEAMRFSAVRR